MTPSKNKQKHTLADGKLKRTKLHLHKTLTAKTMIVIKEGFLQRVSEMYFKMAATKPVLFPVVWLLPYNQSKNKDLTMEVGRGCIRQGVGG